MKRIIKGFGEAGKQVTREPETREPEAGNRKQVARVPAKAKRDMAETDRIREVALHVAKAGIPYGYNLASYCRKKKVDRKAVAERLRYLDLKPLYQRRDGTFGTREENVGVPEAGITERVSEPEAGEERKPGSGGGLKSLDNTLKERELQDGLVSGSLDTGNRGAASCIFEQASRHDQGVIRLVEESMKRAPKFIPITKVSDLQTLDTLMRRATGQTGGNNSGPIFNAPINVNFLGDIGAKRQELVRDKGGDSALDVAGVEVE